VLAFSWKIINWLFDPQPIFKIMKFIKLLALLGAAFFLTACTSTDETLPAADEEGAAHTKAAADMGDSHDAHSEGMLMDQYKSGQIPGYRD
jgi:hypothetical protein